MVVKKLLLLLAVVAIAMMTGCDGVCHMDFVMINQTGSDIVIEKERTGKLITIKPGEEQNVDRQTGTCDFSRGGLAYDNNTIMSWDNMTIGGESIPEMIWNSKYWDCDIDKFLTTYTLTVTDELIESLLSEQP